MPTEFAYSSWSFLDDQTTNMLRDTIFYYGDLSFNLNRLGNRYVLDGVEVAQDTNIYLQFVGFIMNEMRTRWKGMNQNITNALATQELKDSSRNFLWTKRALIQSLQESLGLLLYLQTNWWFESITKPSIFRKPVAENLIYLVNQRNLGNFSYTLDVSGFGLVLLSKPNIPPTFYATLQAVLLSVTAVVDQIFGVNRMNYDPIEYT